MPSIHKIKIMQIYNVVRTITIQVELDSREQAIGLVESGEIEAPSFDDKRWRDNWDLQDAYCGLLD